MKKLVVFLMSFMMLSILVPSLALAEVTYSDWSSWQTTIIESSENVEVETRLVDITSTKTQYTYEYWRYYNNSAGKYYYKGNGNLGGTYYSIILDSKLKFYKDTSDGRSYLLGNGQYINFSNELWFNEREVQVQIVIGQQTQYRSRTIISSGGTPTPVITPTPAVQPPTPVITLTPTVQPPIPVITPTPTVQPPTPVITPTPIVQSPTPTEALTGTPGAIINLWSSKADYLEGEDIIISWSDAENAYEYGLTVRVYPYSDDATIKYNARVKGNSVNIGTLPAGNYRFAMKAYNTIGNYGPVSSIIYFNVKKQPDPKMVLDKQTYLSGEHINISWTSIANASSYTVHISGGLMNHGWTSNIIDTSYWISVSMANSYKIWVTAENNGQTIFTFNSNNIDVKDVLIEQNNVVLAKGEKSSLTTLYMDNTINKSKISYSSSNNKIAKVDSNGLITSKSTGKAIITVYYDGKKMDTCDIFITEDNPILPIDTSLGKWYALTYYGHDTGYGGQYSAVDWNLQNNADKGTPVYAIQSGTVTYSKSGSIRIQHDKKLTLSNGYQYNTWYSWYSHMSNIIAKGTYVKKGDIIGYISKVNATTEHLHFAIYKGTNSVIEDSISPYWLPGDYSNVSLYADDIYGTRKPDGLYETLIFRTMPETH